MKQSKMDRGNGEVKHKTEDERKTKVQLIGELAEVRQRIVELEASEVERERAEELLKLRTKEQKGLLSSVPAFVYLKDTKSKLITANKAFAEMVNTPIDQLSGKDAYDLFPKEQAQKFHIDDQKVMQSGKAIMNIVKQFTDAEGKTRWASSSKVPYFGENGKVAGMVGVTIDITERKKAEQELEARKKRLENYIESMVDGVVLSDLEGTTVDINKACLELLGYKRKEDVVGRPGFIRAIRKKDMPEIDALLEGIIKKGYVRDKEITVLAQDGREIPILFSATLIEDPQGKPTSIFTILKDITERKKAEAQIRKLSSVAEQSIDGIAITNLEPKLTYVNDAFARMHGYSPAEMVGMRHTNLHSEEQMDEFEKAIDQIKTKGSWTGELEHVRKDGTPFPTHMSVTLLTDEQGKPTGITVVCRDITERKKAKERLQESEGKLRVMFGSITDGVIVTDLTGTIVEANDGAAHLVGYSNKEELIGRNAFEFVSPKYRALAMNAAKKTLEEGLVQEKTEYTILTADGREIDTDSSAAVLYDSSGNPEGIINVVRDITERKHAEQELQERNEQLKAQREELVRKATELELVSQAKSEFLASMSHELRTPLSAVIGFSELMLDGIPGEINDEQRGCLNDILDSGRRLLSLINDILDLSKVEAGKIELKLQNLDIAAIISGVVQIIKPVLDKNGQEIEVSAMQGLPKVRGDKNRLEQILLNLLSNASKFTEQGGRVRIHVGRKGDYCQVAVIDTGIGIKKEDQEHVFEAFVQGETLSDRKKEGTGLGLTLTKRFVEAIGGRIWMESEYGKGSTFIFTIPLAGEPLETSLGDKQSSYS